MISTPHLALTYCKFKVNNGHKFKLESFGKIVKGEGLSGERKLFFTVVKMRKEYPYLLQYVASVGSR